MWRVKLKLKKDGKETEVFPDAEFPTRAGATACLKHEKKQNHWVKQIEPDSVSGSTYEIKETIYE